MASVKGMLTQSFDRAERGRLAGLFGSVGLLHIAGWGLLLAYAANHPGFIWLGGVAYMLGLRHAFDADHIAAIDNTTRKLLQSGKKPLGVGFFFSLGHSTVVFLIAVALGLAVRWIVQVVVADSGELRSIGGAIGTVVSGGFLVLIGILNLLVLLDIIRVYRGMRRGDYDSAALERELTAGGLMTRLFGRLFRVIEHSWQMYPIGFLFGLGFDTASEVTFLAVSAGAAAQGLPFAAIMSRVVRAMLNAACQRNAFASLRAAFQMSPSIPSSTPAFATAPTFASALSKPVSYGRLTCSSRLPATS